MFYIDDICSSLFTCLDYISLLSFQPGTSATVDCTPPKAIEAAKCNPRKKAISQEWSGIIEKENK